MCRKYSKNSASRPVVPPPCERWKCSNRCHHKLERESGGDDLVSEQLRGELAERERAAVSDALLDFAHEGTRCNQHHAPDCSLGEVVSQLGPGLSLLVCRLSAFGY